jgi:imidazolonepropionase-like amidohydrolase
MFNRSPLVMGALALALPLAFAQTATPTPALTVYIKAGHLFDATSDQLRDNMVLMVEGERIAKIAPATELVIPAGSAVVDLSQAWVLPGLIDCHTHLEFRADKYDPIYDVKFTPFQGGFDGVVNANRTLQAGFTSMRDSYQARGWWPAARPSPSPVGMAT